MTFEIGKWRGKSIYVPLYYRSLEAYVSDDHALKAHTAKRNIDVAQDDEVARKTIESLPDPLRKQIVAGIGADIDSAIHILRNQMIVVAATYVEAILKEFFQELFIAHPERMHNYVGPEGNDRLSGWLQLSDVIEADTKESILTALSERATQNVLRGKFKKTLDRLDKLTKWKMESNIRDRLLELIDTRNHIVHDALEFEIGEPVIHEVFFRVDELLYHLRIAADRNGIPVSDPATGK